MPSKITRRHFMAGLAAALAPFVRIGSLFAANPLQPFRFKAKPFPLNQVRLLPGPFLDAADRNRKFMLMIDPDRLLHMFRITAGIASSAKPLGGWEAPENELRGHFTGHYLSACAMISASMQDESFAKRGNYLVTELAKCQQSNGYLSAFPEEFFDRLRAGQIVWAPFYTLHKIMAGLLDMHTYCGNEQALNVLKGMVTWTRRWVQPLGDAHMSRILEREYGGMNELLYNFFAITQNNDDLELAHRFDHERIFEPLAQARDELKGLHVNTTIPKIIGAARRYELTQEGRYRDIADYFWHEVTEKRCYCTGGTSNEESWGSDPGKLANELGPYTQECCCTYNMMKLTRQIFTWTANPGCADYYERALFNGILGTQHPSDGMTLYYVPLASGYWKLFGLPFDSFWCCNGTGMESFAKLGNSIYFHDDDSIYVNLFIASLLEWPEKGIRITQETKFPEESYRRLTIHCKQPIKLKLRLRIPYWATSGGNIELNGRPLETFASPSSYLLLDRTWNDGDIIKMSIPMNLHAHPMPDDASIQAFLFGPIVLAGRLGSENLNPNNLRAEPTKPRTVPEYKGEPISAPDLKMLSDDLAQWIQPNPGRALLFITTGQSKNIALIPLSEIIDERYAVYWKLTG